MKWDDLRFLLALARAGSMSGAATALSVNHTTVSRRVETLQQEAGVRLFERLPDGYALTQAGEDVRRVAERMEEEVLSLDRRVLGRDARLSGAVRLTTVDHLAMVYAGVLASFVEHFPEVELSIQVSPDALDLSRREADIALRITSNPPEHLIGRRLWRWELAPFAARSMLDNGTIPSNLEDLPWLAWDTRLGARITEQWFRDNIPGARISCRVDSPALMFKLMEMGVGANFLPLTMAGQSDKLVQIGPVEPTFSTDLWLLTHPDLRHTARIRAFNDHMSREVKAMHSHPAYDPATVEGMMGAQS